VVQRFNEKGEAAAASTGRPVGVPPPPLPPHPIFGRDQAIAELRARLLSGEGVAITALHGLPGVGKTTLATALAHDDAVRRHFQGGVYWAALGPQGDVDSALNRWGDAVEVELGSARDAREKARRLATALERAAAGAPVLLVVDDVWVWEHARAFKEIAFPGCVQVCTTRDATIARKFAGRETWVAELSDAEAVTFLGERCPEAEAADPEGVRELARAVGGLPLGLTLIAAMLVENKGQPRWVRREIERLKDTKVRLALEGVEREGSLQAIVEMSVTALADLGESNRALECVGNALSIFREVDDRVGEAVALNNLGNVYGNLGEKQRALECVEMALPIQRDIGDRVGEAVTLFNIAHIRAGNGELAKAIALLERAVTIDAAIQHPDLASDRAYLEHLRAKQLALVTTTPSPPPPLATTVPAPIELFFSYAHQDAPSATSSPSTSRRSAGRARSSSPIPPAPRARRWPTRSGSWRSRPPSSRTVRTRGRRCWPPSSGPRGAAPRRASSSERTASPPSTPPRTRQVSAARS
jgi:tetratricopeptide (TPR) repeat protein